MLREIKIRKLNQNKRGLSEMISYVLLIAIAIGISTGVFVWLKSYTNVTPVVDCEEGTSVLLESYTCECEHELCLMTLNIKNNGRFNVSGIILTISEDAKREPTDYLIQRKDLERKLKPGITYFDSQLNPGSSAAVEFFNTNQKDEAVSSIPLIKIQPIITLNKNRVVCQNSIIKQPIDCTFP
ncbi:MAG: hypothetical protein WC979_08230 [Candidatus Pacearchaeota archaeon]|jgi:hypothetical protein